MKVFWAILLLLVLATTALFVGTAYRQHAQAEAQTAKARADADAARDFINDADDLSPEVRSQMLTAIGLS